jgi:hypothetical protein
MKMTGVVWPMRAVVAALSLIGFQLFPMSFVDPPTALAAVNAECDSTQTKNSWVSRNSTHSVGSSYVRSAGVDINYHDYALCIPGLFDPLQSSSSAWIAIEGPGSSDIVQVGLIKCNSAASICGNGMDEDDVDWFYAWGNDGDPFNQPWAHNLGRADTSTHRYAVSIASGTWSFKIDGISKHTMGDTWRTWTGTHAQEAVEIHNEGDQLGGGPTTIQTFRNSTYHINSTTYSGFGDVYKSGHCYPWSVWNQYTEGEFDVWTTAYHTNC